MPSYPYNVPTQAPEQTVGAFPIGAAAVGAAVGIAGALARNRQVSNAVRSNYATLSAQQQNAQEAGYQQQYVLGQQSTYEEGAFINSIAGQSGTAYRTVLGQIAADNYINSSNIAKNTANTIAAIQVQKDNVYNSARSQMTSVVGAGLTTANQFFGQAQGIEDALAKSKLAASAADESAAAKEIFASGDPAAIYALTQKNLPATVIQSGRLNNSINDDYNTYVQTKQMQLDAAKAVLDTTRGLYQ